LFVDRSKPTPSAKVAWSPTPARRNFGRQRFSDLVDHCGNGYCAGSATAPDPELLWRRPSRRPRQEFACARSKADPSCHGVVTVDNVRAVWIVVM